MCIRTWRRLFVFSTFQQKCLIKFVSAAFPTVINLWNINDASSWNEDRKKLHLILFIKSLDAYKISSPAYLIDTNWYFNNNELSETWLIADILRFY